MENIVFKVSYLKYLNIWTESEKQSISFLSVRAHDQMNHWIVNKHPSVQNREMFYLTLPVFSTHATHYFHGVVFILLVLLKKWR